jgi:succinoglycan biosynthesis protein ExoO
MERADARTGEVTEAAAPSRQADDALRVSIVMANYNGGRTIAAAVRAALGQSLSAIEIIVCDDASSDDSVEQVSALARRDGRVRLSRAPGNGGPGAARNRCLDIARGEWIAVMDSDDLMHPDRLRRLIVAAEADGADIVADDLLIFDDDRRVVPTTCVRGGGRAAPFWVDAPGYVGGNMLFRGGQSLGYLKPLIRARLIREHAARYDPTLRIAEDFDFVLRLLLRGARFRVYPWPGYFYRKHSGSISHRLSRATLEPMLAAHDRVLAALDPRDRRLVAAMTGRRASLIRALAFDDLISALKRRDWLDAVLLMGGQPMVAALLRGPLLDRLKRWWVARRPVKAAGRRQICVLSRQRIIGNSNGSSVYLLGLCATLRRNGYDAHLLCPSPSVFGRWPALWLRPEARIFRSIRVRRALRVGPLLFAVDPATLWRAGVGIAGHLLRRLGLDLARLNQPAPYSISQPWTRLDCLFVAHHARGVADVIVADYAFQTEGIPYALRPDAVSLVVMHDLFSARVDQFRTLGARDSVATLNRVEEMALLRRADVVVAIQAEEAAVVRHDLPDRTVIVAPVVVVPVDGPQAGQDRSLLFVGSNTSPNVDGLRWFLDAVWPDVRDRVPDAVLTVVGSVCGAVAPVPDGVRLLGPVRDLGAAYRDAAVVISPLRAGSGLKIKLIEAMGRGKAVVATSVTLQGVEQVVDGVVAVADSPADFAGAVIGLLDDPPARIARADAGLAVVRAGFSPAASHAALLAVLSERSPSCGGGTLPAPAQSTNAAASAAAASAVASPGV